MSGLWVYGCAGMETIGSLIRFLRSTRCICISPGIAWRCGSTASAPQAGLQERCRPIHDLTILPVVQTINSSQKIAASCFQFFQQHG
jgi:hypothetical protein